MEFVDQLLCAMHRVIIIFPPRTAKQLSSKIGLALYHIYEFHELCVPCHLRIFSNFIF